ncbi:MAG: hypothetical protein GY749_39605 [Desulfobacteraceae bacterium]|nr:hypothetical protein [Desulfobacteraceae bacterium]
MLEQAEEHAERLREKSIGMYSVAGIFAQVQSAEEFVTTIKKLREKIFTPKTEYYLENEDDDYQIDKKEFSGLNFMHFTLEETEPAAEPILQSGRSCYQTLL